MDTNEEKSAFELVIEQITPETDEVAIIGLIRKFSPDDGEAFETLLDQVSQHVAVMRAVGSANPAEFTSSDEEPPAPH